MTRTDDAFVAAVYVLLEPRTLRDRVVPYMSWERQEIDFDGLVAASREWSRSERLLLQVAQDLWNGNADASLGELVTVLDQTNLQIVLDAIAIRRGLGVHTPAGLASGGGR